MSYDLHCHSNASDGTLSPAELVERALKRGVTHLALTDHDCVGGIDEALKAAEGRMHIIPGCEMSTTWNNRQIHVAALFINHKSQVITDFVAAQNVRRTERAIAIGEKLEKAGFKDAYARTKAQAGAGAVITRGNYARFIFSEGRAQSIDDAFNTYLKSGKRAYVSTVWISIEEATDIIHKAGGLAVLAHPRRYPLTNTKLRQLLTDFKDAGGDGLEVASCQQRPCDRQFLAQLCQKYGFLASVGSDFHNEAIRFRDLGLHLELPPEVTPVWRTEQGQRFDFT